MSLSDGEFDNSNVMFVLHPEKIPFKDHQPGSIERNRAGHTLNLCGVGPKCRSLSRLKKSRREKPQIPMIPKRDGAQSRSGSGVELRELGDAAAQWSQPMDGSSSRTRGCWAWISFLFWQSFLKCKYFHPCLDTSAHGWYFHFPGILHTQKALLEEDQTPRAAAAAAAGVWWHPHLFPHDLT